MKITSPRVPPIIRRSLLSVLQQYKVPPYSILFKVKWPETPLMTKKQITQITKLWKVQPYHKPQLPPITRSNSAQLFSRTLAKTQTTCSTCWACHLQLLNSGDLMMQKIRESLLLRTQKMVFPLPGSKILMIPSNSKNVKTKILAWWNQFSCRRKNLFLHFWRLKLSSLRKKW